MGYSSTRIIAAKETTKGQMVEVAKQGQNVHRLHNNIVCFYQYNCCRVCVLAILELIFKEHIKFLKDIFYTYKPILTITENSSLYNSNKYLTHNLLLTFVPQHH